MGAVGVLEQGGREAEPRFCEDSWAVGRYQLTSSGAARGTSPFAVSSRELRLCILA